MKKEKLESRLRHPRPQTRRRCRWLTRAERRLRSLHRQLLLRLLLRLRLQSGSPRLGELILQRQRSAPGPRKLGETADATAVPLVVDEPQHAATPPAGERREEEEGQCKPSKL